MEQGACPGQGWAPLHKTVPREEHEGLDIWLAREGRKGKNKFCSWGDFIQSRLRQNVYIDLYGMHRSRTVGAEGVSAAQ